MSLNFNSVGCALLIILVTSLFMDNHGVEPTLIKVKSEGISYATCAFNVEYHSFLGQNIFFSKWEEKKKHKRKIKIKINGNLVTRGDLGPLSGHPPALKPTIIASNHITANFTTPTSIHLINWWWLKNYICRSLLLGVRSQLYIIIS